MQILKAGATDYVLKHDLTRLATAVERALADGEAQRGARRITRELESERRLLSAVLAQFGRADRAARCEGPRRARQPGSHCRMRRDRAQAIGRSYADLFAEPVASRAVAALRSITSSGAAAQTTRRCAPWREVTRLGRVILWSASFLDEPGSAGETIVLAGIDITEQQQQEETRARLVAIVDSSDDAIVSKTLDGVITSWNRGAERIFGYTAAEAIGQPMLMLVPRGHEHEEAQILDRVRKGNPVTHFQTVRRRKNGQEISVSITISPLRDAAGRMIGASLIARDISQQKRLEELRTAQLRARGREHPRAGGEPPEERVPRQHVARAAHAAQRDHRLRRPALQRPGAARLADAQGVPRPYPRRAGSTCSSSSTTSSILSKVEAGKLEFFPEPVDLARTIDEVTSVLHGAAASKQIGVTVEIEPGLGPLVLDPARLKQVLYNYLSNALKFTPAGGRVTVRASSEGKAKFRLEVADTGIGISRRRLPAPVSRVRATRCRHGQVASRHRPRAGADQAARRSARRHGRRAKHTRRRQRVPRRAAASGDRQAEGRRRTALHRRPRPTAVSLEPPTMRGKPGGR